MHKNGSSTAERAWMADRNFVPFITPSEPYNFYRTELNFKDFLDFMQSESTLARERMDFLNDVEFQLTDKSKKVQQLFEGDLAFDRSVVRQYLYEYHVKRLRMTGERGYKPIMHYIVAKATKDLLLQTGMQEFIIADIAAIIDGKMLLNYMNRMFNEASF